MENKKLDIKLRPTEIEDLDTLFLFQKVGTDKAFANARQEDIEEYIYKLTE